MPDFTSNIGFSNPVAGECNWDNDWYRNQFLKDIICSVLLSLNRVNSGGEASDQGAQTIQVEAGSATIGQSSVSWDTTQLPVTLAAAGQEWLTNYIYLDSAGTLVVSTTPPVMPFVPICYVDCDEIDVERVVDIRPLLAGVDPDAAVDKVIDGTEITGVFLYDTKEDSDNGDWRFRSQLFSWYSEDLGTATRGIRREFPEVALIVSAKNSVIIYDTTVPAVDMWMVFACFNTNQMCATAAGASSVAMKNGALTIGFSDWGVNIVDFLKDAAFRYRAPGSPTVQGRFPHAIIDRNVEYGSNQWIADASRGDLSNAVVYNVAMRADGGAPIDPSSLIQASTIAVATGAGLTIIDGPLGVSTTTRSASSARFFSVAWNSLGEIFYGRYDNAVPLFINEWSSLTAASFSVSRQYTQSSPPYVVGRSDYEALAVSDGGLIFGGNSVSDTEKLSIISEAPSVQSNGTSQGMINFITSKYQTGYMQSDIKLATLSSTEPGNIGADVTTELVDNGEDFTGASGNIPPTGWTMPSLVAQFTLSSGVLTLDPNGEATFNNLILSQSIPTVVGETYEIRFFLAASSGGNIYVRFAGSNYLISASPGTERVFSFVAEGTSTQVGIRGSNNTSTWSLDYFRVKGLNNHVANGEISSDRFWNNVGSTTYDTTNENVALGNSSSIGQLGVVDHTKANTATIVLSAESGGTSAVIGGAARVLVSGTNIISWDANAGGNGNFTISTSAAATATIDSVLLNELNEPDRSVNNNPLQVFGQVIKSNNVEGGVCGFSGFSTVDYIEQTYNADLNLGTDDFYVMGWVRTTNDGGETFMFSRDESPTDAGSQISFYKSTSNVMNGYVGSVLVENPTAINTGEWVFVVLRRIAGSADIIVNGVPGTSVTATADITSATAIVNIGKRTYQTSPWLGDLSLVRAGAGSPTDDQIAEIYRAEINLFKNFPGSLSGGDFVRALSCNPVNNSLKIQNDDGAGGNFSIDTTIQGVFIDTKQGLDQGVSVDHNTDRYAYADADRVVYHKNRTS